MAARRPVTNLLLTFALLFLVLPVLLLLGSILILRVLQGLRIPRLTLPSILPLLLVQFLGGCRLRLGDLELVALALLE